MAAELSISDWVSANELYEETIDVLKDEREREGEKETDTDTF